MVLVETKLLDEKDTQTNETFYYFSIGWLVSANKFSVRIFFPEMCQKLEQLVIF